MIKEEELFTEFIALTLRERNKIRKIAYEIIKNANRIRYIDDIDMKIQTDIKKLETEEQSQTEEFEKIKPIINDEMQDKIRKIIKPDEYPYGPRKISSIMQNNITEKTNQETKIKKSQSEGKMAFFKKLFSGDKKQSKTKINLDNFKFLSSDHIRYENGVDNYGHQKGANRGIEIKKHDTVTDAYKVTIYNLDGNHPVWGTNIQMHPKRMKITEQNEKRIELKGFGNDQFGVPFSNYAITLHINGDEAERVVLHMIEKKVDIEYFK